MKCINLKMSEAPAPVPGLKPRPRAGARPAPVPGLVRQGIKGKIICKTVKLSSNIVH